MKDDHNVQVFVTAGAFLATLAIWALDFVVPFEVSLFVLYLVPIGAAAHFGLPHSGYAIALLSSVAWCISNNGVDPRLQGLLGIWNIFTRVVVFIGLAFYASRIRTLFIQERELTKESQAGITFLAPQLICEKCGNVSEKGSDWATPIDYLRSNPASQIHSCICPDCVGAFISKENPEKPSS